MKATFCFLSALFFVGAALANDKKATEHCVELHRIDLDENQILDKDQQKKLFESYMGKCISSALLKAVIADISDYYMNRGYITTRPYLKRQTIEDEQIDIGVLTGTVEDIVDASTQKSNARTKTAFAFQKGKLLNLRDLETSLEMMNRVPSSDTRFEIKPGNRQGTSIVEVKIHDALPYRLKIGLTGQKELNDSNPYLTADLSWDNPLNLNDIFTFRYNGSRVQKQYQSNRGSEVNYSLSIASYLMEWVLSDFSYRQGVDGLNNTYLSSGDTRGVRAKISKVLLRNQKSKLNLGLSLYNKNTKNYFSNALIEVSSYKTTLAQLDLTHTYLQYWGRLTTNYSYYQGTDWLGARSDGYVSAEIDVQNQASLQFKKHTVNANLIYYLKDRSYQVTSNLYLQRSADMLYDNDKLTVGSDYTVRGYSSPNLYGNNAWYLKNDVTKTWSLHLHPSFLQSLSSFLGLDYGSVDCETDNQSSCGKIYGVATGFSTEAKNLTTRFVWSRPLKKIKNNFKQSSLFRFDMTWQF